MPIKFSTSTMLNPTAVEEVVSKASSKLVKGERTLADSSLGKMARGYKNLYNKGIDQTLVGVHSLRAGGAMALKLNGESDTVIMKIGR